ncbi:unnamed protein product [Mycena citricolor]|uniref:Uncharacterized protein n=1 Tax=Mycena citricolor TaxID=2018698 RepID=A0AAD2H7X0_9AGAR|nr:unnamed protein product [Mycena citricolor]
MSGCGAPVSGKKSTSSAASCVRLALSAQISSTLRGSGQEENRWFDRKLPASFQNPCEYCLPDWRRAVSKKNGLAFHTAYSSGECRKASRSRACISRYRSRRPANGGTSKGEAYVVSMTIDKLPRHLRMNGSISGAA